MQATQQRDNSISVMTDVDGVVEPSALPPSELDTDPALPKMSDMLFAAAMPKEEIGALKFLKVQRPLSSVAM